MYQFHSIYLLIVRFSPSKARKPFRCTDILQDEPPDVLIVIVVLPVAAAPVAVELVIAIVVFLMFILKGFQNVALL
jgi:uncharacterized radical SAM superfamily protein